MIAYIEGEALEVFENNVIVLVNGMGYKVFPTAVSLERIKKGDKISFYITSIIKEDAFDLYGFESIEEKNLFDMIISISGIGPRIGIAILSKHKIRDIMDAIANGDDSFFTDIPRLGKRNAQKLIIELKSKVGEIPAVSFSEGNERNELLSALKSFGYQEKEIRPILNEVSKQEGTLEEKISYALKSLGSK